MTFREFLEKIREKLRRLFFLNVPVTPEELAEKKDELLQMLSPVKKEYPHNHLRFPDNIYEPEKVKIGRYNYMKYYTESR